MDQVGAVFVSAFVAAAIAIWGILTQRAIARRRATLDLIVKIESDSDLIAARKKFIELAKAPGGLGVWAELEKEQSEEVQSIRLVLNEFELISIGIQRGILDYDFFKLWNRSTTIRFWHSAAPFVTTLRSRTANQALYHEFQELVSWMDDKKMPKRRPWIARWF